MTKSSGVRWTRDTLEPYYDDMIVRENGFRITSRLKQLADRAASTAQSDAPWNDITGAARRGLTASLYKENNNIILRLSHSVAYGEFLETIQGGKYAVIMPTLEKIGPALLAAAADGFTPRS